MLTFLVRTCCDWYDNRITSSTPFLLRVSVRGRVFLLKKDYIVVKHGKGNKERVVPKSPMLSKQLVRYLYVRENYFEGKSNKKIQHFQQTVVCRENTLGFCNLPQLPIKAFDRVRGIDQTADFLRIFEVVSRFCEA